MATDQGPNQGGIEPAPKKTNWVPCAGCAVLVLLLVCVGIPMTFLGIWATGKEAENEKKVDSEPGIPLTAIELSKAFHENDQSAKQKYQDQIVVVTGKVQKVKGKTVILEVVFPLSPVYCEGNDQFKDQARGLKPDQVVKIKGYCKGTGLFSIDLKYCQIQQ
jgi:hypothetical protein